MYILHPPPPPPPPAPPRLFTHTPNRSLFTTTTSTTLACHPPLLLPPVPAITENPNTYLSTLPLTWTTHPALYSDGSCHTDNRGRTISIGAGFYCPTEKKQFFVAPAGLKETNTITRAELAALWACLRHAAEDEALSRSSLTLFTDSLTSLHLIHRVIRDPSSMDEKIHLPLLLAIKDLLIERARNKIPTLLQKVKSHSGIHGNDQADAAAKIALTHRNPHFSADGIDNQYISSKYAWPRLPSADPSTPSHFASNLTSAIKTHALDTPSIADGTISKDPTQAKTYRRLQNLSANTLPGPSNHFWLTSLWDTTIRNILKIRFCTLWTAARAKTTNLPYKTVAGKNKTDLCHLCHRLGHTCQDTQGHLLGACTHPDLEALYIKRHNLALTMIQRSISIHSDLANCYTIMDATSVNSLPPGVSATRIPPWVLPSVPDDQRLRLRPDLLIFEGLTSTDTRLPSHTTRAAPNLHSLQQRVIVHIIELTFTSHHDNALTDKMQQHTLLVHLLQAAGWIVSKADITHRPTLFPLLSPIIPIPQAPNILTRITQKIGTPAGTTRLICHVQRRPPTHAPIQAPHPLPLPPPLPPSQPARTPARTRRNRTKRTSPPQKRPSPLQPHTTPPLTTPDAGGGGLQPGGGSLTTACPAYLCPTLAPLSRFVHIILLGTDGSLFRPLDTFLTDVLHLPNAESISLLHRLNSHSISYTHTIIKRRRALDFDPLAVRLPLVPIPSLHDPP